MRIVQSFFAVSALLFVAGVSLVVVGARATRDAGRGGDRAGGTAVRPIASVRQIMAAIVEPASNLVFSSVSTTITEQGVDEKAPKTDTDWAAIGAAAAALGEAGHLLKADGRAIDEKDWMVMAQSMVDAAQLTLKAVEARSVQGVFDAGGEIYTSCDNCHAQYQR